MLDGKLTLNTALFHAKYKDLQVLANRGNPELGIVRFVTTNAGSSTTEGAEIELTGAEFDLLLIFLERPGRVLSRDVLLDLLHGRSIDPFDRSIDVTMSRLRRKFGDGGVFRLFKTVRNGGYQFAVRVERLETPA